MNKIKRHFLLNEWAELSSNYSIKDVCLSLSFKEAMNAVNHLFFDDICDNEKQQYALKLCLEIKIHFNEWENDWKNEVLTRLQPLVLKSV